ncbi:PAS domain S-box protein [bacterium]|nr:PAS domain S-box protein [bacterium]
MSTIWHRARKYFRKDFLRIIFPSLLTVLLFIAIVVFYFIPLLEQSIMEKKREKTREMIQVVVDILSSFQARVEEGDLPLDEAQARAKEIIRRIRYGPLDQDYFWINTTDPRMVMHPYRTDLEGTDLSNFTGADGQTLFSDFVRAVTHTGSAFVKYTWQIYGNETAQQHKLSFIQLYEPWNWIIGTGVYLDDVRQEILAIKKKLILIFLVILFVILILSFLTVRRQLKSEEGRKEAERRLLQEQQRLRDIIEFLPDATFVIDKTGTVIAWNRAIEIMSGLPKEDMIGQGDFAYGKPFYGYARPVLIDMIFGYEKQIADKYDTMQKQGDTWVAESYVPTMYSGRGAHVMVTASPLYDENGELAGAIESIRDITENVKTLQALKDSEMNYRSIFNATNEAILILHLPSFSITDINQKAIGMFGYTASEFQRISMTTLLDGAPPCTPEAGMERLRNAAKGKDQMVEWKLKTHSGKRFWGEVNLKRTRIGNKDFILTVIRDIDERKQAEEERGQLEAQLQQSQKMEAIGKLAGGIAHDFNNLLTVIQGYCEIALPEVPSGSSLSEYLREIQNASDRAESITKQLLAYTRQQIIQPVTINLNHALKGFGSILSRLLGEDIHLETNLHPNLGMVKADPNQIEQAIMNLSVNAREAMPRGGTLTIETDNVYLDSSFIEKFEGSEAGEYILLRISDTGNGMDETTVSRIFEPFFTTKSKAEGTGLGLSMVYGIVKQNGGLVTVESQRGQGTTFFIYLPRAKQEEKTLHNTKTVQDSPQGEETILLVEDETSVLEMATAVLEKLGYTVLTAENGQEGLELFQQAKQPVSLLLTDVIMPKMSGRELAKLLQQANPTLKILYMSGYTDDVISQHGVLEPDTQFIQKPFLPGDLARKVRAVLDEDITSK